MPLCRLSSETRPPPERAANLDLRLDSYLHAFGGFRGKPLRDGSTSDKPSSTITERPYGEGFNQVTGERERRAGVSFSSVVISARSGSASDPLQRAASHPRRTTSPSPFPTDPRPSTGFV